MGEGYWILLWDGWGAGLTMLNPRLHTEGVDLYGNPRNWFPQSEREGLNGFDAAHPEVFGLNTGMRKPA